MARKDIPDDMVCYATFLYRTQEGDRMFITDLLEELSGEPYKVCVRAMERTHSRNYINYGVSLRTAWLEPKGVELLRLSLNDAMEEFREQERVILYRIQQVEEALALLETR